MWKCRNCKESVDDNLDVCWNCGYSKEGKPPANRKDFNEVKPQDRKRKTKRVTPNKREHIMQKQRPIGVTLFVIWSFIAGIITISSGQDIFRQGVRLFGDGDQSTVIVGAVMLGGGLLYCVGAVGLFQGREWGRSLGIYDGIAISLGWLGLVEIVGTSMFSDNSNPLVKLVKADLSLVFLIALPILAIIYLRTKQVREYCENGN